MTACSRCPASARRSSKRTGPKSSNRSGPRRRSSPPRRVSSARPLNKWRNSLPSERRLSRTRDVDSRDPGRQYGTGTRPGRPHASRYPAHPVPHSASDPPSAVGPPPDAAGLVVHLRGDRARSERADRHARPDHGRGDVTATRAHDGGTRGAHELTRQRPSHRRREARRRRTSRVPSHECPTRVGGQPDREDRGARAVTVSSRRVAVLLSLLALSCKKPVKPGDPLPGLTAEQLARFTRGKQVFDSVFTPHTGLGPLFNSTACGECHEDPVAGGTGDEVEVHATAFKGGMCDPLVQEGGPVIQLHTTPALKAALGIDREPFPPSANGRASRTTPVVFARGLMDLVPDSAILAYADSEDRNHDGVHGRPNRSVDGRIGRFGRKAFVPTLAEFNAGAFVAEMGITNPVQPTEENIGGKPIPPGVDSTA